MKYFCYRHIRPDKNEPFYIGIGKKPSTFASFKREYARAFVFEHRSFLWNAIYNKNGKKIDVEILYESDDYEEIKEKEKEFIKVYGRIIAHTGTLVNLTDGGDGNVGWKPSLETRKKIAAAHSGVKYKDGRRSPNFGRRGAKNPLYGRKRLSHRGKLNPSARAVDQFDLSGNFIKSFPTMKEAALELFPNRKPIDIISSFVKVATGKHKTAFGFIWTYKDIFSSEQIKEGINTGRFGNTVYKKQSNENRRKRRVCQYTLDGYLVARYKSIAAAATAIGGQPSCICNCCGGGQKHHFGFVWKYDEEGKC